MESRIRTPRGIHLFIGNYALMTQVLDMAGNDVPALSCAKPKNRSLRARTCAECGKVEQVRTDNPAKCCRSCTSRIALDRGRQRRSDGRHWETCQRCGLDFPAPPSNRQLFCTWTCRRAAQSVKRTCVTCGGQFRVARSVLSGRTNSCGRFCSRLCYERYLCRTPRVRGRGSCWKRIRRDVLRQTPFCSCCGKTQHLQVHHIIPFRLSRDNTPTNLIPLCRACHKRVEAVFNDIEAIDPPLAVTKLVLFCGLHACRTVTLHLLKNSAHAIDLATA